MTADRTPCCVPFCRRTAPRDDFSEIMCGKHWRLAPSARRRVYTRIVRAYRRKFGTNGFWAYPPGSPQRLECVALTRRADVVWAVIKRMVVERAGGL